MPSNHYDLFQDYARKGLFNGLAFAGYLQHLSESARHIRSPVNSDAVFDALQESPGDFESSLISYTQRYGPTGKIVPLDEILCIEEDHYAIFIENTLTRRNIKLTTFENKRDDSSSPLDGILVTSTVKETGSTSGLIRWEAVDSKPIIFYRPGDINSQSRPDEKVTIDLAATADAAINQLVYMERKGLLPYTP